MAVRRRNARKIGELFARQAGKMVAVSAGDSLETVMAAHGSGAVARSIRDKATVMNVDVGGGTAKIAVCAEGRVIDVTALDVGARLVCLDPDGRIARVEEAGRRLAAEHGISLEVGKELAPEAARALAAGMAERLFEAMRGRSAGRGRRRPAAARAAVRSPRRSTRSRFPAASPNTSTAAKPRRSAISACCWRRRSRRASRSWGPKLERSNEGIRATVIGASQYTTQVSGSTIYVSPLDALPLRNVPVIAPRFALDADEVDSAGVAAAITAVLKRLDLGEADTPVAIFVPWRGSATFQRLDAFCQGVVDGLASILADGHPLVLAGDGDVGGLMGIHLREEMQIDNTIVSVDGLELKEFDYIDIGAMLPASGAVPVVIKSLIFPVSAAPGMEWQPAPPRVVGEAGA